MQSMVRAGALSLALLLCLAGCSGTDDPPAAGPGVPAAEQACDGEVLARLAEWEQAGFSGTVSVLRGGKLECSAGLGLAEQETGRPNTDETVFSIGSVSKAFDAAAVGTLVERGELRMTDRAGDLVAGLEGPAATATVGELLTHTSGLTGSVAADHSPLSKAELVRNLSRLERAAPPKKRFLYSNAGYALLSLVVEEVSGVSYREFLTEQVLDLAGGGVGGFWDGEPSAPGPRAVGYLDEGRTKQMGQFAGPHWALSGNGDLAMTTDELASWTRAFFTDQLDGGDLDGILAGAGADLPASALDPRELLPGWAVVPKSQFGTRVFATAGGGGDVGHNAVVAWSPSTDVVVAAASNTQDILAEKLLQLIGPALVAGDPPPAPSPAATPVDPAALAALAGIYDLPSGGAVQVTATRQGLELEPTGADAVAALFPASAADVSRHEALVEDLLAGGTTEGRKERAWIAKQVGEITAVRIEGTVVGPTGLQTYATVTGDHGRLTVWYELNDAGGVEGAEGPTDLPTLTVVPRDDTFVPLDPTATEPAVRLEIGEGSMTIRSDQGETRARLR
jgi:CubicO group peptidase (beta-lactamase class C family)